MFIFSTGSCKTLNDSHKHGLQKDEVCKQNKQSVDSESNEYRVFVETDPALFKTHKRHSDSDIFTILQRQTVWTFLLHLYVIHSPREFLKQTFYYQLHFSNL
jgi:hypothetical protein